MRLKIFIFLLIFLFFQCNFFLAASNDNENNEGQSISSSSSSYYSNDDDEQIEDWISSSRIEEKLNEIFEEENHEINENDLKLLYKYSKYPDDLIQKSVSEHLNKLLKSGKVSAENLAKHGFVLVFMDYLKPEKEKDIAEVGYEGLWFLFGAKSLNPPIEADVLPILIKYLFIWNREKAAAHLLFKLLDTYPEYISIAIEHGIIESCEKLMELKTTSSKDRIQNINTVLIPIIYEAKILTDEQFNKLYSIISKFFDFNYSERSALPFVTLLDIARKEEKHLKIIQKNQILKKAFGTLKYLSYKDKKIVFNKFYHFAAANNSKVLIENGLLKHMRLFLQDDEVNEFVILTISELLLNEYKSVKDENIIPMIIDLFKHENETIKNLVAEITAFVIYKGDKIVVRDFNSHDVKKTFCEILTSVKDDDLIQIILLAFHKLCDHFASSKIINKDCWKIIMDLEGNKNEKISLFATDLINRNYKPEKNTMHKETVSQSKSTKSPAFKPSKELPSNGDKNNGQKTYDEKNNLEEKVSKEEIKIETQAKPQPSTFSGSNKIPSIKNTADNKHKKDIKAIYLEAKSPDLDVRKSAASHIHNLIQNGEVSLKILIEHGFLQVFTDFIKSKNQSLREYGIYGLDFYLNAINGEEDVTNEDLYSHIKSIIDAGTLLPMIKNLGNKINDDIIIEMINKFIAFYMENVPIVINYGIIESLEKVVEENEKMTVNTAENILILISFLKNDTSILNDEQNLKIYSIISKIFENKNNQQFNLVTYMVFGHALKDETQIKLIEKSGVLKKIFPKIKYMTEQDRIFKQINNLCKRIDTTAQIFIDNGFLKHLKYFLLPDEVTEDALNIIFSLVSNNVNEFEEIRDENIIPMIIDLLKHENETIKNIAGRIISAVIDKADNTLIFSFIKDVSPFCDFLTSIKNDDDAIIEIFHALNEMFKTFSTYDKRIRSAIVNEKCWDNIKFLEDSDNEQISDLATEIIDKYYSLLEFDKEIAEVLITPFHYY